MSLGTIISRLTGVVRLAVLAAALGVAETHMADAYNLANTVPNIIYELVLGGVITSVFVPTFVELIEKEDRERAWEVFSGILNVSLLALAVVAIIGVAAAPWIASFYSSRLHGADAAAQQHAIEFLLRLFIPQIVLYGLYFIVAGLINAHRRYGPPMFTPIVNNLVLIGLLAAFAALYGRVTPRTATTTQLLILGLGTTASVAPMGLLLLPYLRRLGRWRPTLAIGHPSVKRLARLSAFVVGMVVANQVGAVVIQYLASGQRGGYTAYIAAQTFFLMPLGLFVWSINTALLTPMSEHAVHQRWDAFRDRVSTGVRAVVFLMVPTTIGFIVLAEPIVRLLIQHGEATRQSTDVVVPVLRVFMLGLLQFSLFQLFVRAFYAMHDTRTPFWINCGVVAINIAINVPMYAAFKVEGLAAGQAIAYTAGIVAQGILLGRRIGGIESKRVARSTVRVLAAGAAMGVVVWEALAVVRRVIDSASIPAQLAAVVVPVAVGAVVFLGAAWLLRIEELGFVRGILARKLRT
jgi:putative peptidoglycan lipid II flippase